MATIRDYRQTSQVIADDLDIMFAEDPDAFDVLLYHAKLDTPEVATTLAQDVVGSLESDERLIEYEAPVRSRAIFLPFDVGGIVAMDQGDMAADMDTPIVMLIQGKEIPKASVVQYDEYVGPEDTDIRRVTLYVMHSEAVGQSPACAFKYYLIPFFDETGLFAFESSPDEPSPPPIEGTPDDGS